MGHFDLSEIQDVIVYKQNDLSIQQHSMESMKLELIQEIQQKTSQLKNFQ